MGKPSFLARAGWALRAWLGRRRRPSFPPALILVTDPLLDDARAVLESLPAGMLVVLRDYHRPDRAAWAAEMAAVARRKRLILLVAGDFRLAAKLGAAGLHLPEGLARGGRLAPALLWCRQGRRKLTVSAHSTTAIQRAWALGADAAFLSPVFPTRSHPDRPALGGLGFRARCRQAPIPVVALGGIARGLATQLLSPIDRHLAGLAAIRLFRQPD